MNEGIRTAIWRYTNVSYVSQAGYAPKPAILKRENVTLLMSVSWRMRRTATRTDGEVICPLYPKHIGARSSKTLVDGTTTPSRNVRHESPIHAAQYLRSTQSSNAPLRKLKTSQSWKKKRSRISISISYRYVYPTPKSTCTTVIYLRLLDFGTEC